MAASSFSVTSYISKSSISDFSFSSEHSKTLMFLKFELSRRLHFRRRSLSLTKVASRNQELQNLIDQSVKEETTDALDDDGMGSLFLILNLLYQASNTMRSSHRYSLQKSLSFQRHSMLQLKVFITNWNATYELHEKMNVKQAYYLSMEFLQGRALLNAIGNLELSGAYAEALRKHLEDVARQVSLLEFTYSTNKNSYFFGMIIVLPIIFPSSMTIASNIYLYHTFIFNK